MTPSTCKGIVRNNVVVPENGVQLPEGAEVELRLLQPDADRDAAFQRVLQNPIRHPVGIDEIIDEDKRDRDERGEP